MTSNYDFWGDRSDKRVRAPEFNNLVLCNNNFVISGCAVTAAGTDMDVDVASGSIAIGGEEVSFAGDSVTLSAADADNERCDLIAINSSGVLSAIEGTPANPPLSPDYTEEDYVIVAFVIVQDGASVVSNSDIHFIGMENKSLGIVGRDSKIINELMNGNYKVTATDGDGYATNAIYLDDDGDTLATETNTFASFKSLDDLTDYNTNTWEDEDSETTANDGVISTSSGTFIDGTDETRLTITNSGGSSYISSEVDFGDLSEWIGVDCETGYVDILCDVSDLTAISDIELQIGADIDNYRSVTLTSSSLFYPVKEGYVTGLRFNLADGSSEGSPDEENIEYIKIKITNNDDCTIDFRELTISKDATSDVTGQDFRATRRNTVVLSGSSKTIYNDYFYDSEQYIRDKKISGGYD